MPVKTIPLLVPDLTGSEMRLLRACIESNHVAYTGAMVREFEAEVAAYAGSPHGVATNSGTSALHLAMLCLGVGPGDLVPISGLSFIAPANAIRYAGADPIFIDVDAADWQMDPVLLGDFLERECRTEGRTCFHKATGRRVPCVTVVHSLGYATDMEAVVRIAERHHVKVVEDAAGAFGSFFRGRHLGTFGAIGILSFNGNKLITTSGGGMLLTADAAYARRALHLSTQTKQSANYFHDEIGYNYRMTNLCAALGLAQFERREEFLARKREIHARYVRGLAGNPAIRFPATREGLEPNHWTVRAAFPRAAELDAALNAAGIQTRTLWMPLHTLPMFGNSLFHSRHDHAAAIFAEALCLPSSTNLTAEDQDAIVAAILGFYATDPATVN
jgi:perosamine synthetase